MEADSAPTLERQPVPLRGLRRAFARWGYAGVLVACLALCATLIAAGLQPATATSLTTLTVTLALWALERVQPFSAHWVPDRRTLGLDIAHSLLSSGGVAAIVRAGALWLTVWLGGSVAQAWGFTVGPATWPIAAQVVVAVGLGDFGAWAVHRWMHHSAFGWRLHAVHHTARGLHVFAAGRTHPFNSVLVLTAETIPALVLGLDPVAIALMTAFKGANGQLQHANLDLRPGALSRWLTTCENHRWHHSADPRLGEHNFGNSTMLWDRLFGTFHLPPDRAAGDRVGLDDVDVPESFVHHMALPFRLDRWARPVEPPHPAPPP